MRSWGHDGAAWGAQGLAQKVELVEPCCNLSARLSAPRCRRPPPGDSDYRLPALLLCDLERPGVGGAGAPGAGVWVVEAGPDYLCLGGDNKLYQVRG